MAKLHPFKYRFMSPEIQAMNENLWFKSHQELLLRVVNTPQGRELLCIDKAFDRTPIVGMSKNRVTGFLGFKGGSAVLKSDFRVGSKWANVVRHRWPDFVKLAREHYSDKVNGRTEIMLNGGYRMAATTSTFFPDPHPESTSVDGLARFNGVDQTWSAVINDAGDLADDSLEQLFLWLQCGSITDRYNNFTRLITLFDTNALEGTVTEASLTLTGFLLLDQNSFGSAFDFGVYTSDPASNTAIVASDYAKANFGTTELSDTILNANTYNASGDNVFDFNSNGLAAIATDDITKLAIRLKDWDVDENQAGWGGATFSTLVRFRSADFAGTGDDPKLIVTHVEGGVGGLINGGLINNDLTKGRLVH